MFKDKLRQLRLNNGYTQEKLANLLSLHSTTTIANYESGLSEPSINILIKLATVFNCSMDYLIDRNSIDDKEIKNNLILDNETRKRLAMWHI